MRSIQAWKAHQLRSVQQDKSRLDILELLNNDTILIVNDCAMKFLPQLFWESQQDWFAKRGISWHIAVVFRRLNSEIQRQGFVHIVQSCSQDSTAVVLMIQYVLKTLKTECPEVTSAYLLQDNAGCYRCANTVLACRTIEESTGIKIARQLLVTPKVVKERRTGWQLSAKATSVHTSMRARCYRTTGEGGWWRWLCYPTEK